MFSSKSQLLKRTPENGTNREEFLSLLVDEYLNSSSYDAKCQVLANLANFAYDPINYNYIRCVGVLDIFLYVLKNETNGKLLHYASAGICNLCIDPLNAEYILTKAGLQPILKLLKSDHTETTANAITTLIYLYNNTTKTEITSEDTIATLKKIKTDEDNRTRNVATILLNNISPDTKD